MAGTCAPSVSRATAVATLVETYARAQNNQIRRLATAAESTEESTENTETSSWFQATQLRSWLEESNDTWYCTQLAAALVLKEASRIETAMNELKKQPFYQTEITIGANLYCPPELFEQAIDFLHQTPPSKSKDESPQQTSIIGSLYI